ncbi:MAG: hypothetical protein KR126chlam6_00192 [Candidatus Anoxychlamydiales bacterium]|nr:hypothetical protein [Candidatus Anoxychlamydiales bacterium]
MFEELQKLSRRFLSIKNHPYKRYLIRSAKFSDNRLSLIIGQRGVGKTTTLVQSLLGNVNGDILSDKILYIQADHFKIGSETLYEIAEEFVNYGGKWIAFDEVHKYQNWAKELKSIYDTFDDLQILASGSSALEIYKRSHDLSRRAIKYKMRGMSFREYLELTYQIKLNSYDLEDICENHEKIAFKINKELNEQNLKILPLFQKYLKFGYYPYFLELNKNENLYQITLEQNMHTTIESDLASIFPKLTGSSIKKIKQLLILISDLVPFIPNWQKILQILEINDHRTLKSYFKHLEDADLIISISRSTDKFKKLESSEKVYLNNPNQLNAISTSKEAKSGTIRETFFLCQMAKGHIVTLPKNGDFCIDKNYIFEVGGKNKNFKQIRSEKTGYIACDNIEIGIGKKIPLWLFGFLY